MSHRSAELFLGDILDAVGKIEGYIRGLDRASFAADPKTIDAVARNLEIIGEASGRMPEECNTRHVVIPWRQISGLRNRIIHEYFNVDVEIVWQIVVNDIPALKSKLDAIRPASP